MARCGWCEGRPLPPFGFATNGLMMSHCIWVKSLAQWRFFVGHFWDSGWLLDHHRSHQTDFANTLSGGLARTDTHRLSSYVIQKYIPGRIGMAKHIQQAVLWVGVCVDLGSR